MCYPGWRHFPDFFLPAAAVGLGFGRTGLFFRPGTSLLAGSADIGNHFNCWDIIDGEIITFWLECLIFTKKRFAVIMIYR